MAPSDIERDLQQLEAELKRLEAEYNMFFAGRLPRPPWETRNRVQALVKQLDRTYIQNTGFRFRFYGFPGEGVIGPGTGATFRSEHSLISPNGRWRLFTAC